MRDDEGKACFPVSFFFTEPQAVKLPKKNKKTTKHFEWELNLHYQVELQKNKGWENEYRKYS